MEVDYGDGKDAIGTKLTLDNRAAEAQESSTNDELTHPNLPVSIQPSSED